MPLSAVTSIDVMRVLYRSQSGGPIYGPDNPLPALGAFTMQRNTLKFIHIH